MAARIRALRPARPRAAPTPPAPSAAAEAVSRFLDALGLPAAVRGADDLADTPRRVAEAWLEDLVDGYRHAPAEILAETIPSASRDLVAVTGIDFHSVCPHHLLPSRGVAHVAYVPGGRVVGFGQIVRLVDCLAHRLVLEEDLARGIADALVHHVGARGAACVLDAEQLCMTVRGERRPRARAHAEAFAGVLARDGSVRRRFEAAIVRAPRSVHPERGARAEPRRAGEGRVPAASGRRAGSAVPRRRGR
ncbi:GTP cyclohydrolase I [Anaeromyxobacter oryzae]|uniref:GTP cyclohydrolase I n=1 Tax=Anaeromyxobacter oryzae TaxID=2918170 RepID=A0ABM7X4T1_9BACT|nr:GTP cyclohydrolase I [Anaeromyxobacter oryzae]BDG06798.1 GTP cyclohydrolase 1 [Anaeromyxobacter oryzae]